MTDWIQRIREEFQVAAAGGRVCGVRLLRPGRRKAARAGAPSPILRRARREIRDYLDGKKKRFDLPVDLSPFSPFMCDILRAAAEIPYGETRSYAWVAERAGHPRAFRAAGQALHRNPISLLIPCHRVVGSGGDLVGFASGLKLKAALLAHERGILR